MLTAAQKQLAKWARQQDTRTSKFTRDRPRHWRPFQTIDPRTHEPFTECGAWEFIAEQIEAGHPISELQPNQPSGNLAYWMVVELQNGSSLYVELELSTHKVIGRSFFLGDGVPPDCTSLETR